MSRTDGAVHPADHFRCEPWCPCTCSRQDPYEANIGSVCRNCGGLIKRKRVHRFETVSDTGRIRVLTSVFSDLEGAEP